MTCILGYFLLPPNLLYSNSVFSGWRGSRFPHSHVSVRVLPVGISVSHRHPRDLATTAASCTCCTQLMRHQHMVHRLVIAKCIVSMWYLKDNKNRPYANELIAAVESPCANGGVLTFVLDCIRSASPGSTEIFGRRLAISRIFLLIQVDQARR